MSVSITLPNSLEKRLIKHAESFNDSPSKIIERLLDKVEELKNYYPAERLCSNKRDYTKYKFNGKLYGKCRLVQAVLAEHIANKPNLTYQQLEKDFPKELQGSIGCFLTPCEAERRFNNPKLRCFYDKQLNLRDGIVLACSQWGQPNISAFIKNAQKLGYDIQPAQS